MLSKARILVVAAALLFVASIDPALAAEAGVDHGSNPCVCLEP